MRYHGRFERQKSRKAASGKKIVLSIAVIVLVLILIAVIGAVAVYKSVLDQVNKVEVPDIVYTRPTYSELETEAPAATAATEPQPTETTIATEPPHVPSSEDYINFLVVGQSARPGEDSRMADSMMLLTLNTYEKTLTMTSCLRDTLLERGADFRGHSIGNIKLTTVYHLGSHYTSGDANEKIAGSMELMNIILNRNFGIEVDHNFEVDFDIFIKVIDLMGGVTINLTEAEAEYLNNEDMWVPYDVTPGWCHLDGTGALAYARMRKAEGDSDSDIKRTARQRHVVERVIAQLNLLGIARVEEIAREVLPMVSTSMDNTEITETLMLMLKILPELRIVSGGTCPVSNDIVPDSCWGEEVDIYGDGFYHSVMRFDINKNIRYFRALTEGEVN